MTANLLHKFAFFMDECEFILFRAFPIKINYKFA